MAKSNKLDKEIESAWYRLASGVQVNILDIPKIFAQCRLLVSEGMTVDDSVKSAMAKFRLDASVI